jgi:hypothetical protein
MFPDRIFNKIDFEVMEEQIVAALTPLLKQHRPLLRFEWFTKSQHGFTQIIRDLKGIQIWVIRMGVVEKFLAWRALKFFIGGQMHMLKAWKFDRLDNFYLLTFPIPKY